MKYILLGSICVLNLLASSNSVYAIAPHAKPFSGESGDIHAPCANFGITTGESPCLPYPPEQDKTMGTIILLVTSALLIGVYSFLIQQTIIKRSFVQLGFLIISLIPVFPMTIEWFLNNQLKLVADQLYAQPIVMVCDLIYSSPLTILILGTGLFLIIWGIVLQVKKKIKRYAR